MSITAGTVAAGRAIWLAVRPWRRLKVWRNKRRVAKGKAPLELSEDDMKLFPAGTMRKTGVGLVGFSPVVAMGLTMLGVGECTPEAVEQGCMGASAIAGGLMSIAGGVMYWIGFNRAKPKE
jgi:hypothetical protein